MTGHRADRQKGDGMKKVRTVLGAVIPAVGMMVMPTAIAHASTTKKSSVTTATHTTGHHRIAARPDLACTGASSLQTSPNGELETGIRFNLGTRCVGYQSTVYLRSSIGLGARIRYRSKNNGLIKSVFKSKIDKGGGITYYSSSPDIVCYQVWQAITSNHNKNDVFYGPIEEVT